jgi:hypothetical protein
VINIYCNKCGKQIVLQAFSYGTCKICNKEIVTAHTPCNIICEDCSKEKGVCESCGKDLVLDKLTTKR